MPGGGVAAETRAQYSDSQWEAQWEVVCAVERQREPPELLGLAVDATRKTIIRRP